MNRRSLIASGLATLGASACASTGTNGGYNGADPGVGQEQRSIETYTVGEIKQQTSDFLGVAAETVGQVVERVFRDQGEPTAYIAGEEGSGAVVAGVRYGRGLMYMKDRPEMEVFWQGPTIGFDWGGNASRVFTLCYNLHYPDMIFRRYPGVDGSAYLIGGVGVNYQRADGITLAPIRTGVGLRLGASIGYLSYSRERNAFPF
ncbi:DUF1134 domain-containing protein [Caulobacter sp. SLTY]|uniref:DUF1134 domain-containing protein n=1 Tax=Caulobacter sp. SLTY TaxID=2683262 RepID=UPI00141303C1|nr:DUF1134 domain-containing protein [Caulobacter sp. SLTY]NBB16475.1 DUF1134 domain-containing protein [Caulobacter sp. SLTY]